MTGCGGNNSLCISDPCYGDEQSPPAVASQFVPKYSIKGIITCIDKPLK